MTIFYADDDEEDREIFCDVIAQINPAIEVVLAKDGQEALDILKALTRLPEFIFLDINMPRVNGVECVTQIKSDDRLKVVPVIIYSTTFDAREVKKMMMLGAEDFISKVGSLQELKASIHNVLLKELRAVHE